MRDEAQQMHGESVADSMRERRERAEMQAAKERRRKQGQARGEARARCSLQHSTLYLIPSLTLTAHCHPVYYCPLQTS